MNFFPSWIVVSSRRLSFFIFLLFFVGQISLLGNLNLTVKGSPASLDAWQNGSVTFTLSNDGSESISSIEVSFDIASSKLKGGNEYQASQGTLNNSWTATPVWQVGNLSAGQSANLTLNIFSTTNGKIPISGKISVFQIKVPIQSEETLL